jgi:hypothetical protein
MRGENMLCNNGFVRSPFPDVTCGVCTAAVIVLIDSLKADFLVNFHLISFASAL